MNIIILSSRKTVFIFLLLFLVLLTCMATAVMVSSPNFVGRVAFRPGGTVVQGYNKNTGEILDVNPLDRLNRLTDDCYNDGTYYNCSGRYYRPRYLGSRLVYDRVNRDEDK